jgi:hypothetical protein
VPSPFSLYQGFQCSHNPAMHEPHLNETLVLRVSGLACAWRSSVSSHHCSLRERTVTVAPESTFKRRHHLEA